MQKAELAQASETGRWPVTWTGWRAINASAELSCDPTFQHLEYYMYAAQPDQQRDFRQLAQAGADIVSGSQAHQPQGMEFLNDSFIHYGLGNLFFDQYGLCEACRQGLIDQHVFYDGRYIRPSCCRSNSSIMRARPMTFRGESDFFQICLCEGGELVMDAGKANRRWFHNYRCFPSRISCGKE
jgi:hypothetical protein